MPSHNGITNIAAESSAGRGTVTALLVKHGLGDDQALAEALTAVYGRLQYIASRCLANERPTPTFDEEALVHEAYLRLARHDRTRWANRGHLFAVAARIMRRILVDRARAKGYAKRAALKEDSNFEPDSLPGHGRPLEALELDDALTDLARYDENLARLVELRFFGGLTNREIAEAEGVVPMTVIRRWRLARAWLERYLRNRPTP